MISAWERVYNVQCYTFNIARELTDTWNNVTTGDTYFKPPFCLRIVKEHRTKECKDFRNLVARVVKERRLCKSIQ